MPQETGHAKTEHVKSGHLTGHFVGTSSVGTFVGRFVVPVVGILEGLTTGKMKVRRGNPRGHSHAFKSVYVSGRQPCSTNFRVFPKIFFPLLKDRT